MRHHFKNALGKGVLAKVRLWQGHMKNRQEGKPVDTLFHVLTCSLTHISNDMYAATFKLKYSLTVKAQPPCACRSS